MSSARLRIKRPVPSIRTPTSAQLTASHQPNKGLLALVTLSLVLASLLIWNFAPVNFTPKRSVTPATSIVKTSFIRETVNLSLFDPSSAPLSVDVADPSTVGNPLSVSVPVHTDETGARFRHVVDKKIASGMVTLKDEQTGELSTITQPLATNVNVQESNRNAPVLSSAIALGKPLDPVKAKLPTQGIETIKAGMTVPTRNPITGATEFKKVTRTFKRTAYEIVELELADAKTDKIVDSLRGTPEHPFFTPGGMIAMGDLQPEMKVTTRRGLPLVVKSVTRKHHPEGIVVYNFEVEGDHTYFVGNAEGGTWVHNKCDYTKLTMDELKAHIYNQPDNINHLRDFFGRVTKSGVQPSNVAAGRNLSRGNLEAYRELAQRIIDAGKDSTGVQASRIQQINDFLKGLP